MPLGLEPGTRYSMKSYIVFKSTQRSERSFLFPKGQWLRKCMSGKKLRQIAHRVQGAAILQHHFFLQNKQPALMATYLDLHPSIILQTSILQFGPQITSSLLEKERFPWWSANDFFLQFLVTLLISFHKQNRFHTYGIKRAIFYLWKELKNMSKIIFIINWCVGRPQKELFKNKSISDSWGSKDGVSSLNAMQPMFGLKNWIHFKVKTVSSKTMICDIIY